MNNISAVGINEIRYTDINDFKSFGCKVEKRKGTCAQKAPFFLSFQNNDTRPPVAYSHKFSNKNAKTMKI